MSDVKAFIPEESAVPGQRTAIMGRHKSVQMMETRVGEESKEALETKTAQVES